MTTLMFFTCGLYLQLDTFFTHGNAWLRLVTVCHELLYFIRLDLYTVSMTC